MLLITVDDIKTMAKKKQTANKILKTILILKNRIKNEIINATASDILNFLLQEAIMLLTLLFTIIFLLFITNQ